MSLDLVPLTAGLWPGLVLALEDASQSARLSLSEEPSAFPFDFMNMTVQGQLSVLLIFAIFALGMWVMGIVVKTFFEVGSALVSRMRAQVKRRRSP